LEVAGFPAVQAIIHAILAKPDLVCPLAERAIALTLTIRFFLIAEHALELFCHDGKL